MKLSLRLNFIKIKLELRIKKKYRAGAPSEIKFLLRKNFTTSLKN
jgi:hypothetical protein